MQTERYPLDVTEHGFGIDKSRRLAVFQIYLSDVASDDGATAFAEPSQKHFHLFGSGVLRLVEYYKRSRQRASAHISERRDFHHSALDELLIISAEHIAERVVQRAQIRIDFHLQIAGQKSEFLARLDRGARKDYPVYKTFFDRVRSHCDGEIRLTRSRRSDRESEKIASYGVRKFFLLERFRINILSARVYAYRVVA